MKLSKCPFCGGEAKKENVVFCKECKAKTTTDIDWNEQSKYFISLKKKNKNELIEIIKELKKETHTVIIQTPVTKIQNERKSITLYTDGACLGNPGNGGWGTILDYKGAQKEFSGGEKNTTNNRMELMAVIKGLEQLKEPCDVKIVSDSQYVLNSITKWIFGWIKKDFKDVKNPDLWKQYLIVSKGHNITTEWVKGHNGHPENERCDLLATNAAKSVL